jgi:hypothetical protein
MTGDGNSSDDTDRHSVTWDYGPAEQQHIRDVNRAEDRPDTLALEVDGGTVTATGTAETIRWLYDYLHYLKRAWRHEGEQWDADAAEEMAESLYEQVDGDLPERQRTKEALTDGGTVEGGSEQSECTNMECSGKAEYAYWMPDLGHFSEVRSPEHDQLEDGDLAPYVCESCRDRMAAGPHWDADRFVDPRERLVADGGTFEDGSEHVAAPWWCPWCEAIIVKEGEIVTDESDAYWHAYDHRDKGPHAVTVMEAFEVLDTVETEQHKIEPLGGESA